MANKTFTIKPLVWEEQGMLGCVAETPFGDIFASKRIVGGPNGVGYSEWFGLSSRGSAGNLAEAKTAAESHYIKLLSEALVEVEDG